MTVPARHSHAHGLNPARPHTDISRTGTAANRPLRAVNAPMRETTK